MLLMGIICGMAAAVFQSFSYVFTQFFLSRKGTAIQLMAASQLLMGVIGAVIFFSCKPDDLWREGNLLPLFFCASGALIGQLFVFAAQRSIEVSRLASLYGLKLIFVAILAVLVAQESVSTPQIIAIAIAIIAGMLMNYRKGKVSFTGMLPLLFGLLAFSWSDIGGKMLVGHFSEAGNLHTIHSALLVTSASAMGQFALSWPFSLYILRKKPLRHLTLALPYVGFFLAGVVMVMASFFYVGAIYGNVLQSARGPVGLLIGIILSSLGFTSLEAREPGKVWMRRIWAALLMMMAIVLYALY